MEKYYAIILKGYIVILILFILLVSFCIIASAGEMKLDHAVIHHTASPDWSVERIRKIHVEENGWSDVGYNYLIRADGTIEKGRDVNIKGAHARGRNHYIGIALTGYDTFTNEQIHSLVLLIKRLAITHIERHHEECPGSGLDIEAIRKELNNEN